VSTHAAFLRGINLGPRRRVASADLRTVFESLGFGDVATFRASGNVVFAAGRESAAKLGARIEKALEQALGYDVTVFVRSAAEIRAIAAHEPFARKLVEKSKGKLQVALLSSKPSAQARKQLLAQKTDDDHLSFEGRELYWLPIAGIRDSKVNKSIEKLPGSCTVRTKGTMEQLAEKYFD
jgi:uncharacterized protein (DUF1697 family)